VARQRQEIKGRVDLLKVYLKNEYQCCDMNADHLDDLGGVYGK
jgi:hypothetical protein